MSKYPTFEVTSCQTALFEWADSYDTKDLERLKKCIDYRSFLDKICEAMPRDEFILMASNHFVGLGTWEKISDDEIMGRHQLRVRHQRYTDDSFKEMAVKDHAQGTATMWYKKVEGGWKFAGVCQKINWTDFDYDKVFARGRSI